LACYDSIVGNGRGVHHCSDDNRSWPTVLCHDDHGARSLLKLRRGVCLGVERAAATSSEACCGLGVDQCHCEQQLYLREFHVYRIAKIWYVGITICENFTLTRSSRRVYCGLPDGFHGYRGCYHFALHARAPEQKARPRGAC
jgi:hypothetical protein